MNSDSQTTPQSLAERVKRLREFEKAFDGFHSDQFIDAMQTINDLVNLVGEMHNRLMCYEFGADDIPTKSAPIAALAKEKEA